MCCMDVLFLFYMESWLLSAACIIVLMILFNAYINIMYVLSGWDMAAVVAITIPAICTYLVTIYGNERNSREFYYLYDKSQKNKASLKKLLQSLPDGVIICHNEEILYWNQTMCDLLYEIDVEFSYDYSGAKGKADRKAIFRANVPTFYK